jgi:stage V sporulation protein B
MRKKTFLKNLLVSGAASVALSAAGVWFRAYLSRKIGAEALGLHQLTGAAFLLCATLSSSGVTVAVARLASEARARGENPVGGSSI